MRLGSEVEAFLSRLEEPAGEEDLLGTEEANDESAWEFDERLGRCYELTAYAIAFGDAPEGSTLVHGSWHGVAAPRRIGHAWVRCGGRVWEPIKARWYDEAEFLHWTAARVEKEYDEVEVRVMLMRHGHYGRWHQSRYP